MHALCALLVMAAPALANMTPADVDGYLAGLRAECPDFEGRLNQVTRDGVGTPYVNGPLGEGPEGKYDQDPLIDLARVDCVTFVEQAIALAASASYQEAVDLLQKIRYRDGVIDFQHRNHFMLADWTPNNPWCVDVTAELGVPVRKVTRTISKRDYFERVDAPELGRDIRDAPVTVSVVPPEHVSPALDMLDHPTLIVFVGKIDWLFALHCGLYLPSDGDGPGALYHASSKAERVVAADLAEYMKEQQNRYLGFAAYTIGAPRWQAPNGSDE